MDTPASDSAPRAPRSAAHWLLAALAPTCLLALLVLGGLVAPSPSGHGTHTRIGLPPCLSMQALGLPCPGCGVTTSVALAARGRLGEALHNQPFGVVATALLALYPAWALWQLLRGRDLLVSLQRQSARAWMVGLGSALFAAWIYKLATGFPA